MNYDDQKNSSLKHQLIHPLIFFFFQKWKLVAHEKYEPYSKLRFLLIYIDLSDGNERESNGRQDGGGKE